MNIKDICYIKPIYDLWSAFSAKITDSGKRVKGYILQWPWLSSLRWQTVSYAPPRLAGPHELWRIEKHAQSERSCITHHDETEEEYLGVERLSRTIFIFKLKVHCYNLRHRQHFSHFFCLLWIQVTVSFSSYLWDLGSLYWYWKYWGKHCERFQYFPQHCTLLQPITTIS